MGLFIPVLVGGITFLSGAFVGAQVDDAIEPPAGVPVTQAIDPTRILLYGGGALLLLYGAQRTGLIKGIK